MQGPPPEHRPTEPGLAEELPRLDAPRPPGGPDADRSRWERDELLAISRALSSERDIHKLLAQILRKSRQITGADAGSVYVLEDAPAGRLLRFILSQNDSVAVDLAGQNLAVDGSSIVGQAVLEGRPINVADLGEPAAPRPTRRHNRSFDDRTGYQARSMLTVPMTSARNEVIGVIQLINKKRHPERPLHAAADFTAQVIPFDPLAEELAFALASQAGVCLENAMLYQEITTLFEGFVDASVKAIEARDPTTSGHSRRVATLSVALAERVDAVSDGPLRDVRFSPEDLRQLEYAGVLHDFGKVGVREHVLVKAKKLYDWQKQTVELRFRLVRRSLEVEALRRTLAVRDAPLDAEHAEALAALDEAWTLLLAANEPALLDQPTAARLRELGRRTYLDVDGQRRPWLEPTELEALEVPRGSLTPVERREIQSHVTHTMAFLEAIPWGRALAAVPRIAGAHHELMDGSGYPHGWKGEEIPIEARILTIADIFDALTAADRPYKTAVPLQRALDILAQDVKQGRCDPLLFEIFREGQIYRRVL
jgi:HD-GYP domain-containing protein (c-di-GMP phosphodiesterase class II)